MFGGIAYLGGSLPFSFAFESGYTPAECNCQHYGFPWVTPDKDPRKAYLRSFDMVVEIISECLDVRDGFFAPLFGKVSGKED